MKSLMSLWMSIADDLAMLCCTSATSDKITVRRRVEHEGLSFLTITLPSLGKSTRKWIDQGEVGIHPSFTSGRGSLPLFLGGFFNRVFDPGSGALLDAPSIDAIFAIEQLTLLFEKISLPCSSARERKAIDKYVECEQDVRRFDSALSESDLTEFIGVSNLLFRSLFTEMDRKIYLDELVPKHGPGAVADRLTSNGKYRNRTWTKRLDRIFPIDRYLIPNHHFVDELEKVSILEPGAEMPVKVITVPKTLKTPRIIAVEPTCMQYTQQALLRCFLDCLERDRLLSRFLGFDDQVPNQDMARLGSKDGSLATLDLSDASDRVSNQLVRSMTSRWPYLQGSLDASRSRRANVPGYGVIRLAKYASMGSATCFPVEAMVFLTLIFVGIQRSLNAPLTRKDVSSFLGSVRVYGDDLIVPRKHVLSIVDSLQHFGAVVGASKSFWTGRLRESCGKVYYDGTDVTSVRVRSQLPSTVADAKEIISTVSLRNQLFSAGFRRSVEALDAHLVKILKFFPFVHENSPVLGRVTYGPLTVDRADPDLQIPLVKGFVVKAKIPSDPLDGVGALHKCLLKMNSQQNSSNPLVIATTSAENHLERSGRPKRVSIKLGWWPVN